MKSLISKKIAVLSAVVLALAASASNAAGFSDLTAAISFADVIAAIFAIGVLVLSVDMAMLGFHKVRQIAKAK